MRKLAKQRQDLKLLLALEYLNQEYIEELKQIQRQEAQYMQFKRVAEWLKRRANAKWN